VPAYQGDWKQLAPQADAAVLMVAHQEYITMDLDELKSALRYPVLIDGRGMFRTTKMDPAWSYRGVGQAKKPAQGAAEALGDIVQRGVEVAQPEKIINAYIPLIIERLKKVKLSKLILFGSYAYGQPKADSDIDLLVVINSESFPKDYGEKSNLHLEVSRVIRDIKNQTPVDLIVHTRPMHRKFIELDSMFSKEVLQRGKVLYEADNESMA